MAAGKTDLENGVGADGTIEAHRKLHHAAAEQGHSAGIGATKTQAAQHGFVAAHPSAGHVDGDKNASLDTETASNVAQPAIVPQAGLVLASAQPETTQTRTAVASPASTPAASATSSDASSLLFTAGDLVISVYGDGANTGSYTDNQASPVVLEELTTSGTYVTQLELPQSSGTNGSGVTEYAFSGEYGSSSEGSLELSADGQSLVIAGYAINAATYNAGGASVYGNAALAQSTSIQGGKYTAVARAIADVRADGTVDTSTALYNVSNTNNPRSVATVNGSSFYLSGQGVKGDTTQGVFLANDGASSATAIDTSTDTRTLEIYNGALYVSRDSKQGGSGTSNVASYGSAPPTGTTAPITLTGISGTDTLTAAQANTIDTASIGKSINLSPENFFFANSTTLYIADSGNPKQGGLGDGGLQKWVFNGSSWNLSYTLSVGLNLVADTASSGTTGLIGLTGQVVGNSVLLYATNATIGDLDPTYLYGITDSLSGTTGAGESFTTLATAAADTNIRGVSFAPSAPCYAAGTAILTASGPRAVEHLRAGDIAIVLENGIQAQAPIVWVGHRAVDVANHPDPAMVRPIRFAAGAIADGVPSRPLLLSPDHALLLDGVLIAARQLANGASITVENVASVVYVHVELERHGILLAENTPAESFLDTGNRHQFAGQASISLHARFDRAEHPDACARLATDAETVQPIWRRLADRARVAVVRSTTREAGLVLTLPDGSVIAPHRIAACGRHSFWLDGTQDGLLTLCSRSQSPASLRPWLDDRRKLGVAVSAVMVWTEAGGLDPVALPLDVSAASGWWEAGCGDAARWTDGEAALVVPLGCVRLDVMIAATAEYALAA